MALYRNPARSDALAVALRALRACRVADMGDGATWASFRVAVCGDRACWRCAAALCRGDWVLDAFCTRMANVSRGRLRGSCVLGGHAAGVLAALCRGDWVPAVSQTRMILRAATCVSRGRCGTSDALMRSGRHWTVDPRSRRNKSCAVAKIAAFRGPVRQICCAGARWALRNRPWICGCELGADVSWNAAAGCVGRVACALLCRGTQWQAVTMGVGCVARVCGAVPWGLLLGAPRGCRCAMDIAARRVASLPLCHGDCWWACCLGGAVPWGLLGSASSRWRRVIRIG